MCYYTLTMDRACGKDGHTTAIMIVDARDERDATSKFLNAFGAKFYNDLSVTKGIHIEQGFDQLLTDQAKKYILKVKSNAKDAPPNLFYQNMIHLAYKED